MATVAEAIANVEKIQHDVDVYLAVPVLNDRQRADLHTDLGTLSRDLGELKALLAAPVPGPTPTAPVAKIDVPNFGLSNKISSGLYSEWVSAWMQRTFPDAYKDYPQTVHAISADDIIAKATNDGCLAQVCAAGTIGNPDGEYADKGDWSLFTGLLGESGVAGSPSQFVYKLYIMGKPTGTLDSNDPNAGLPWAIGLGLDAN